jgi:hypothetical protein
MSHRYILHFNDFLLLQCKFLEIRKRNTQSSDRLSDQSYCLYKSPRTLSATSTLCNVHRFHERDFADRDMEVTSTAYDVQIMFHYLILGHRVMAVQLVRLVLRKFDYLLILEYRLMAVQLLCLMWRKFHYLIPEHQVVTVQLLHT